jgi:mannose-6-phosphate isomerase-like protein (cupin superfamily)
MRCRKEIVETDGQGIGTSASHIAPGRGGMSLRLFGELVTCKITSYQTGGAYSLFEVTAHPGAGPPPHVQHREDEAFCILEGEYEFLVEGRTIDAGAGSLIYVPKGNLHAHINVGEGIGRMLVSQTPGGLHERFFEEIGEEMKDRSTAPAFEDPPDMERIAKIAAEYGIEIAPPLVGGPKGRDATERRARC